MHETKHDKARGSARRAATVGLGIILAAAGCTVKTGVDATAPSTTAASTTTTADSGPGTTKRSTTTVADEEGTTDDGSGDDSGDEETTTTRKKARTTTTEDDTPTTVADSSGRASAGTFSATTRFKGAADWSYHTKPASDPTAKTSAALGKIIYDGPNKAQVEVLGPDNVSSAHSLEQALEQEVILMGAAVSGDPKKVTISGDSGLFQMMTPPATSDDLAAMVVVMHGLRPYYVVLFCAPGDVSTDVSVMAEIADSITFEI